MQDGNTSQTHDVPEDIRQQLYEEEKKSLERHKKTTTSSAASPPPIHITNVLPASSCQSSHPGPDVLSKSTPIDRLNIPGARDQAVEDYYAWQKSQNKRPELKLEY
jgi:hypothetical protein